MRKVTTHAFVLLVAVCAISANASTGRAIFDGGTGRTPPEQAVGSLDTGDLTQLNFEYKAGRNLKEGKYRDGRFSFPYAAISDIFYGQQKGLFNRQTTFSTMAAGAGGLLLMIAKSRAHFVTIVYADANGVKQTATFEVKNDAIQQS